MSMFWIGSLAGLATLPAVAALAVDMLLSVCPFIQG